jgi:hypothetical protein
MTTTVDGRKRRGALTREITYQRVLIAIHMMSDERGVACDATVAEIARESGHSVEAVRRSIGMMFERGLVDSIDSWDGLNRRILVLVDHPLAFAYMKDAKARIRAKREAEVRERVAKREARSAARKAAWDGRRK